MSVQTPAQAVRGKRVEAAGEKVGQSKGFKVLARAGFVARSAIYAMIGIQALELAVGAGGKTTNQSRALETISWGMAPRHQIAASIESQPSRAEPPTQ